MKNFIFLFVGLLGIVLFTSCTALNNLTAGIPEKNLSGNGTVVKSVVGIDPDTKIPGVNTTFISGDFSSTKSGTNSISYRSEENASIWNAKCITKKQFVSITLNENGDVAGAIKAIADVLNAYNGLPAKDDEEATEPEPETETSN